jgi:methylmalonyl-CoA/ethylmalonyl-CoA epimerase
MDALKGNPVVQIGIIVRDIEKALDKYCAVLSYPRPNVMVTDGYEQSKAMFNGEPTDARAKLAFIRLGQVDLELIEPLGGKSTWQQHLDEKGESVHHIAFRVEGTQAVVDTFQEQFEAPLQQQGHYTGGMYTYIDTQALLGVVVELLEDL